MFKKGDIITGTEDNGYSYTSNHALMVVGDLLRNGEMDVHIIYHAKYSSEIGDHYSVNNSNRKFRHITFEEFMEKYPDCYKMDEDKLQRLLAKYPQEHVEVPEEENNSYVLSEEMRTELIEEMKTLLIRFGYHPTENGLNKILDEWCKEKADLIRLFEKHPNYNGKFQIAFDYDFNREFNYDAVYNFKQWLLSADVLNMLRKEAKIGAFTYNELYHICRRLRQCMDVFDYDVVKTMNGKTYEEYRKEFLRFDDMKDKYEFNSNITIWNRHAYEKESFNNSRKIDYVVRVMNDDTLGQFIDNDDEDFLNDWFPNAKIKAGQKTSRAINKILHMLGIDKHPDYNKEFAKFSDAINPLKIKRHTVLSIHPVDYFTMSFGNSWSSCHTIDRCNSRRIDSEHSYRGCNSSGTMSYMLDGTSCVFYTVDGEYHGNQLELEDKINRCMFHYYDNKLLQARVYPQSNDSGANDLYKDIRAIVQKIFADLLEVPNLWTNKKGVDACDYATRSYGTHYRDYYNFETCNVSTLKDKESNYRIEIGHNPICPCCGDTHHREKSIECNYCE